MGITLYGGPQTRASMPRWYMEEKGIPYELVEVSIGSSQNLQPEFLAVNPFGKLPAMRDDAVLDASGQPVTLFESGAILLHLAEHHGAWQPERIECATFDQALQHLAVDNM